MLSVLLFMTISLIISCQNESDEKAGHESFEKNNDITIIINGHLTSDTIKHKDGSFVQNTTPDIIYTKPNHPLVPINTVDQSDSTQTIKILDTSPYVIVQSKMGFDDFDFFILKPGDSVLINYNKPTSEIEIINRSTLKYDLGLFDLNEELPMSASESYNRNNILLIGLVLSEEEKLRIKAKHQRNVETAKKYYKKLLVKIDSVYKLGQMSRETFDAYKTYYTYKSLDNNEILKAIESFSPEEQDSAFKYPFFREPLYFQYSKLGYRDVMLASGRGAFDYKAIMDSVISDKDKLSGNTSDLLLHQFMVRLAEGKSTKEAKDYFEKFRKNVRDTSLVRTISAKFFFENISVSSKNTVVLANIKGEQTNLNDLVSSSNDSIFYIDLWASWCAPCIAEMPASKALREDTKNMPIGFVYLSIDKNLENWKRSSSKLGLSDYSNNYVIINRDSSEFLQSIDLSAIPRYLLIDKKGKLLESYAPSPSSDEIRKVLKEMLRSQLK